MILLTTIIMIIVLTILVLTLMQAVFLYIKVSNQLVSKHEALYQLEAVAHRLMAVKNDPNCVITDGDPNEMVDLLLHNHGCSFIDNNLHYQYVIDDLGLYPCLQIVSGKKKYSSHHWLITAARVGQQDILQLRVAKPSRKLACDFLDVAKPASGQQHQITTQAPPSASMPSRGQALRAPSPPLRGEGDIEKGSYLEGRQINRGVISWRYLPY